MSFSASVRGSLDHDETKRGYKSLAIRDTVTADDFLTWLEGVARKRNANLALVVIDFAYDTLIGTERNALDGVPLGLTAACTHGGRLLDDLLVDFNLALHDVACFKDGRFEAVANVLELHTA